MKHALVYAPFALWKPHFEIDLELAQTRLDEGWRVTLLACQGELSTCEPNERHRADLCQACAFRFRSGMKWLNHPQARALPFHNLTSAQRDRIAAIGRLNVGELSLDAFKSYSLADSDIGVGAYSSLVSMLREPSPELSDARVAGLARRLLVSAAVVHFSLTNHLTEIAPDELIVFNGRFAALLPALRAAQTLGITTRVHEQANELSRYYVTTNVTVHDLDAATQNVERIFAESPLSYEEKRGVAVQWFEDRRASRNKGQIDFVKQQRAHALPSSFSKSSFNVGVFISSEDEFASLTEWRNPTYASQGDGIAQTLASFAGDERFRFFVRMHPNLAGLDNSQTRELERIAAANDNVELIRPESSVSTYALLDACDAALTFGTTVGAEALYARTPSLLMGRCFYERVEGVIRPANHAALVEALRALAAGVVLATSSDVELGMVKYGFAMRNWGWPARYVRGLNRYHAQLVKDGVETELHRWPRTLPERMSWKLRRSLGSAVGASQP